MQINLLIQKLKKNVLIRISKNERFKVLLWVTMNGIKKFVCANGMKKFVCMNGIKKFVCATVPLGEEKPAVENSRRGLKIKKRTTSVRMREL